MRTIVVTGGSRGIGLSIAERFRADGARVVTLSRTPPVRRDDWYTVDVRDRTSVQRVFDHIGVVDVLVQAAGVSRFRALEDLDEAFVAEVADVSVRGALWCAQAAVPHLSRGASIVNISSLAGKRGSARNSVYCAAKFALNGLTQALAKELGPRGIRVNAVCPVYVRTQALEAALAEAASPAGPDRPAAPDTEAYLADFARTQTALGRLPTAAEVAEVVCFLASPAASAITGQCINVDCGVLPQ